MAAAGAPLPPAVQEAGEEEAGGAGAAMGAEQSAEAGSRPGEPSASGRCPPRSRGGKGRRTPVGGRAAAGWARDPGSGFPVRLARRGVPAGRGGCGSVAAQRPAAGAWRGGSGGGEGRRRLLWRKGTVFLCEAAAGPCWGEGEGGHQPGAGRQSRRGGCTPEPERGPICCRQGAGGREGAGLGGEQGGRVSVVQVFQNQLLPHLEKALLNVMHPQREGEEGVLQSFSDVSNVCILQKMYLCYVKHSDDGLGLSSGGVCLLI